MQYYFLGCDAMQSNRDSLTFVGIYYLSLQGKTLRVANNQQKASMNI